MCVWREKKNGGRESLRKAMDSMGTANYVGIDKRNEQKTQSEETHRTHIDTYRRTFHGYRNRDKKE